MICRHKGFIQSVGYDEEQIKQFWQESNQLAKKNDMDNNLAYMYKMIQEAVGHFLCNSRKAYGIWESSGTI